MKRLCALAATTALLAATAAMGTAAQASTLYDNSGPSDYNVDAWTTNFGFAVADSFTLSSNSTVTGLDFATWDFFQGDNPTSVDWAILTGNPGSGGTVIASGTASASGTFLETNGFGFSIYDNTISLGSQALAAGTYWIELQNSSNAGGNPIYWDQSDGPSSAWQSGTGNLGGYGQDNCGNIGGAGGPTCSENFQILGSTSAVPEPAAWAMMLVGFIGLGAGVRSRRRAALAV